MKITHKIQLHGESRPSNNGKKFNRKARVTILIGLICREGVVLASDSQGTQGTEAISTEKISRIKFDLDDALVSKAGDCIISDRLVEIIQEKAFRKPFDHPRLLAEIAEGAIRDLRDLLVDQDQKERFIGCTALMLAQFIESTPSLFTITDLGVATKVDGYFAAAGCGAPLARCLLSEFTAQPKTLSEAMATAIYVIEKVKRYDAFCGGQTKVKFIVQHSIHNPRRNDPSNFGISKADDFPQDLIDSIEREVASLEQREKSIRTEKLSEVLTRLGKLRWETYLEAEKARQLEEKKNEGNITLPVDKPEDLG